MNRSIAPARALRIPLFLAAAAAFAAPIQAQAALAADPAQGDPAERVLVDLADAVAPAVVSVNVFFDKPRSGRRGEGAPEPVQVVRPGSGVVVDPSGLVLTNHHLVEELILPDGDVNPEYWALVTTPAGRQYRATVEAFDVRTDLALLRINPGAARLAALPLGDSAALAPGERVLALSFYDMRAAQFFAGVYAPAQGPVRLREAELAAQDTILSDARFHGSLDGGPLVDLRGRIVGLHNSAHVSERSDAFGGGEEDENEESKLKRERDYAVIVSSTAIRGVFGERLGTAPLSPVAQAAASEGVATVAAIAPSVVSVWTGAGEHPAAPDLRDPHVQRPVDGLGSGVVLTADGYIATASELFKDDHKAASVRAADGALYPAELVALKRAQQVAIAKVALPEGVRLTPAPLAHSQGALQGEMVAVVARPLTEPLLSVGVLSALERSGYVQVASWLHRGHLGGAVVDRAGRVLAIAVAQPPPAMGRVQSSSFLGFATPLADVLALFEGDLAAARPAAPAADAPDAVAARQTAASRVAELTKGSLVNVIVSKAIPPQATGFDPFGEPEPEFTLLGQGSGVIIDPSGLALTNWHVVDAALEGGVPREDHRVEVTLPTGERYVVDVLSTSRDDDLGLIALRLEPGQTLVPVELGDSDALTEGQPVIAIGNPLGLANSVSLGIVSRKSIDSRIQGRLREYKGMVMVDAAINPGNSGGALLDTAGRLVGINSAGRVGAGMAIPVAKARAVFADKLLAAENLRSSFLGFQVAEEAGRLVVRSVEALGPAADGGLQVGDEVLAVDGRSGVTQVAFARTLLAARPGTPLGLTLGRAGESLEVSLTPIPFAAWQAFLQSGMLLRPVDYAAESELVHAASVALHRRYVGDAGAVPTRLMGGALRAVGVRSLDATTEHPVRVGDLVLAISRVTLGETADTQELLRLEDFAGVAAEFDERATKEGELCELWLWRDGAIVAVQVWLKRPPRKV